MQIYSDNFGRVIWLTITPTEIRLDQQDLAPDFEYERCATVSDVAALCTAFKINHDQLEERLLLLLQNQMKAFDLFSDVLNDHQIHCSYYSR